MVATVEQYRYSAAADLQRYRVGGGTRVEVVECFVMRVAPMFQVSGLLICGGIVKVNKLEGGHVCNPALPG